VPPSEALPFAQAENFQACNLRYWRLQLTLPVALITNTLAFAAPPAVDSLLKAEFQVVVHDVAFISSTAQEN
jgi:hypothetical protein